MGRAHGAEVLSPHSGRTITFIHEQGFDEGILDPATVKIETMGPWEKMATYL
ncbi:MAG: hypothetical protein QMD80_09510 [archaeon]|nr:hypothetical protein [archaeon]